MAVLTLSNQTCFAKGGERAIYLDPRNAERLIKVLLPSSVQNKGGPVRSIFTRFTPNFHRSFLLRQENQEYLRLMLKNLDGKNHLPLAHLYGFVETDLGLGFVTQRIHGENMGTAPTWRAKAKAGEVEQRDIDALSDFCRRMLRYGVRSSDLTASNVVLGYRTTDGVIGPYEAVLIDGFGDTHVIPVRTWSKRVNKISLIKRFNRLGAKTGVVWNSESKKFKR